MASKMLKNFSSKTVSNIWRKGPQKRGEGKESMINRWANYWKNVLLDYKETITESYEEARKKPHKFIRNISGLLFFAYCGWKNPSERDFYNQVTKYANELAMVGASQRNPVSENRLFMIQKLSDQGLVRRFSIGIASFMWISNYEEASGLYAAQCDYLKPTVLDFHRRVLDVGWLGKWWILERDMKHYDNPLEL